MHYERDWNIGISLYIHILLRPYGNNVHMQYLHNNCTCTVGDKIKVPIEERLYMGV